VSENRLFARDSIQADLRRAHWVVGL